MELTPDKIPIIQTATFQRLRIAIENVAVTAGLGIVKGPVGIGKSFALSQLKDSFKEQGYDVILTSARTEAARSINMFINDILAMFDRRETQTNNAANSLREIILRHGDRIEREKRILIVDESQMLSSNILETLRGLYDQGDAARRGEPFKPAFGLLLVGNSQFLTKSGGAVNARYSPLMDRLSLFIELDGPSAAECLDFARVISPDQPQIADMLAECGRARGNFRVIEKAAMQANFLGGGIITVASLEKAIFLMKGRK